MEGNRGSKRERGRFLSRASLVLLSGVEPPTINMNTVTCSLARDARDCADAFRLRYRCYRRSGAITACAEERFSDDFDGLANQFTFLLRSGGEAVATVRISVVRPDLGWTVAPSARVFGDHEAFRSIAGESFVEASRLCFHEQARRDVLYRLVANMAALSDAFTSRWLLACPREEHTHIYERLFGFRTLACPRQYFGVSFRTGLMAIAREELRAAADRAPAMRRAWDAASRGLEDALGAPFGRPASCTIRGG
jgi:hypothetical protein